MGAMKGYTIGIASMFIISIVLSIFTGYVLVSGDPFSSSEAGNEGLPDKDPGTGHDNVTVPEEEELPGYILPLSMLTLLCAGGFLFLSGRMYIRSGKNENLVRMDLLDLITVNPGINLTSIRKELELSQGAVSYHIMKLEKSGKIFSDKGSKERRYYPSSMGYTRAMQMARHDEMASILSNETSSRIVELLKDGPLSQNDLVKKLGISPSTVHWHMERLIRASMIRKEQRGRSVYYELMDMSEFNT